MGGGAERAVEAERVEASPADVTGLIFDIKRFAVHDGPGIRTTIFFKGCPLHCRWCHNPESISPRPQLMFFPRNCIECGRCVELCPNGVMVIRDGERRILRDECRDCGTCTQECYAQALVMSGRTATAAEVVDEAERDAPFYENSGGGVTVSGGEPFAQPTFLSAVLTLLGERGLHTAVDTSGDVPFSVIESMLGRIDLFLYDLKHADSEVHREWTGTGNERILANLSRLADCGATIVVRTPVVSGFNDTVECVGAVAELVAARAPGAPMELLPYHRLGESKHHGLGTDCPLTGTEAPSKEHVENLRQAVETAGVSCRVEG